MISYTLQDGRQVDAGSIAVVTVTSRNSRHHMEIVHKNGEKLVLEGGGILADAAALDRLQSEECLTFGVFYKRKR